MAEYVVRLVGNRVVAREAKTIMAAQRLARTRGGRIITADTIADAVDRFEASLPARRTAAPNTATPPRAATATAARTAGS